MQRAGLGDRSVIAISGGATPRPLYEMLGSPPLRDSLARREVTWVLVDERYVPADNPQSNSRMIRETLFRGGIAEKHRFLDFDTSLDDPSASARRFEETWSALGLETLDIVLLGLGEDGHTASLFPGTAVLDVQEGIAAAVYVPRLGQWRVTLTLPVIRSATLRIVLATRESKAAVVQEVANGVDHPVARAMSGEGERWWLIDRAAAGRLSDVTGTTAGGDSRNEITRS